jgi:hypothetical protein
MSTKWSVGRWNTFRWGQSAEFERLLDLKSGNAPHFRLIWHLDAGDQDITEYYLSGGSFAQEKERPPERLTAGDTTLVLSNRDGTFTEMSSSSFLYGVNYHNRKVSLEIGLEKAGGTIEYYKVGTMLVDHVDFASDNNQVVLHLYDAITRLLNMGINQTPSTLLPALGASNVGNGTITAIATRPFTTVTENWTLTCTTPGGSGTAKFSVVGSVSGNVGTATDGTQFLNATTGGVRFTIQAGTVNWALTDVITFSTSQMMQWTASNPVKIMWSILTGYNWDTDVQDAWYSRSAQLDHTQSSSNADLDYAGWSNAVDLADAYFTLTGFIPWDYNLADALEEINLLFLGAFPVDAKGRLSIKIFRPEMFTSPREFADDKKNRAFKYTRDTRDVINMVTISYRKTTNWPWSDDDQDATLDGKYVATNQSSYTALLQWYTQEFKTRWYNAGADHVTYLATRIIDKYGRAPRKFTITTGIDGLEQQIGDIVSVTDTKLGFDQYEVEVMKKEGNYDRLPIEVILTAEDTGTFGVSWAFLGSSANEADGLSPQAAAFDSATATDKYFCYLSQTGGSGSSSGPDYYLF